MGHSRGQDGLLLLGHQEGCASSLLGEVFDLKASRTRCGTLGCVLAFGPSLQGIVDCECTCNRCTEKAAAKRTELHGFSLSIGSLDCLRGFMQACNNIKEMFMSYGMEIK